jgi:predicted  nucleic acid-binding Zn-ribbon protein
MVDSRPSQREFDQLERAMEASRDNVRELKAKLRDLAGADDQYREELDDDKEKMDQYEQELDSARNSNSLILTKLAQTRRLVNKLMQQRNEALSLVRKYRLSLEQGGTERARDESDIRSIRARVAGLNLKLQRANAVQKNLRGLLREHKVMINGLKKLLRSRPSQDQVDELNRALKASRETIKALKAKLQVFADSDDAPASDEHDDHHRISITVSAPGSRPSELA